VPDSSLERTKVALGCEIQHASDPLNTPLEASLDATAKTKGLHCQLLNLGLLHQLRHPGGPE
jgi:hypothetical protein